MKKLPEVNESFEELYRMLVAPIKSKLLLTGIELRVFNHLSESMSADAVAEAIGTHLGNTRVFLDGLAASDLLTKKNGLYQNTEVTQTFLVEGSPTYIGEALTFRARTMFALDDISKRVRKGPPSIEECMGNGEIWNRSASIYQADYQRAGLAHQAAEIVSKLPEFPSLKKMLDLGGGPGITAIALVAAHPSMRGVIFDKPVVVKVAETFIKEYGMEDRMEVLGGDFDHDPLGERYDLIWTSGTLNFSKDIGLLVKKIYSALNPGGVFISLAAELTHERTEPPIRVLGWLPMMLMGQGIKLDQGTVADAMLRSGFKSVISRPIDTPMGPMDLDIGRKKR